MTDRHPSRALWHALEPIHAVTYFDPGCRDAASEGGLKGFWMGYFAFRASPLGPVGPAPVEAMFAGFRPAMVTRALPDAWSHLPPAGCLALRVDAAAAALRRVGIDEGTCAAAADRLEPVVAGLSVTGRPLAAANQSLALPDDPVERLWQATTTLREHRGDGHVAAIVANGLSGLEAHVLQVAAGESVWGSRGWTDDERADAEAGLRAGGLLDRSGGLTPAGAEVRARVEAMTDEASWRGGLAALGAEGVDEMVALLQAATRAAEGVVYYPNPIGLPAGG